MTTSTDNPCLHVHLMRRLKKAAGLALLFGGLLATPATRAAFSYLPAGDLIPGSGDSAPETAVIHVTDMRFPIEKAPAYANSPVYGVGGYYGPSGSQCAASNYDYPWRDNFCETAPSP